MNLQTLLQTLPRYHQWAYEILFEVMDRVSETDYFAQRGMVFASMHGTLNHLYLGDTVWYHRFANQMHHFKSVNDYSFDDYQTGKHMLRERCERWIELIDGFPDPLPETKVTHNFAGKERVTAFLPTLLHVFNHATHHRGQMSVALTQLGLPAPEMDLLYYLACK